jgi:hypothetical protein
MLSYLEESKNTGMIKWPSIEVCRLVSKAVQNKACFTGLDANGKDMFDRYRVSPALNFEGTVKLHGTNAAVVMSRNKLWAQSRENIITPSNDNAGSATFVGANEENFTDFLTTALSVCGIEERDNAIAVFGEWCGDKIQT